MHTNLSPKTIPEDEVSIHVGLLMPLSQRRALRDLAHANDRTFSDEVRDAIAAHLERNTTRQAA